MKHRISDSLLIVALLALITVAGISGCAQNKPATPKGTLVNEYSAYLFSIGNVLYYDNDLANSVTAYRMALRYDPLAIGIKKALFNTIVAQTLRNDIPPTVLSNYVDTLLVQNVMDKQMLEQTFDVMTKIGNNVRAKEILDIYFKKYTSARAYSALFYLEQTMDKKSRVGLLDKAFKLAGNDAQFLNSLGYLYLAFDASKAEKIWIEARKYDTTTGSAQLLWELYARQKNSAKLHKLWNSYQQPDEIDKLSELINNSFETGNFETIIMLSDVIMASDNQQFILTLLQSAWYTDNNAMFEKSRNKLMTMQLSKPNSQLAYFYNALYNLGIDNYPEAAQSISRLDGKNSLDELVGVFRASSMPGKYESDDAKLEQIRQKLRNTVASATNEQLALPLQQYLLTVADSLELNKEISVSDAISMDCVLWFYNNNRRTYDTYIWLAQCYNRYKLDLPQKTILHEALDEYPNDAALLNWLGYSYVLTGDNLEEAEALIRRALSLAPDNPFYLDSLAWLYYLKGDFNQALTLIKIPEQLEKMPSEVAFHIGSIYYATNDKDKAIQYLKLAIDTNDDQEYVAKAKAQLDAIQP